MWLGGTEASLPMSQPIDGHCPQRPLAQSGVASHNPRPHLAGGRALERPQQYPPAALQVAQSGLGRAVPGRSWHRLELFPGG